jgi:CBS domain-containing protein
MGFRKVYDYEAGKQDWLAYGLPIEGELAAEPSAAGAARRDVPTCTLGDELDDVRRRVREAGWATCMVLTDDGVLIGRLGRHAIYSETEGTIEDVMTEGPSTTRAGNRVSQVLERLRRDDLRTIPVTTSDGRLVGLAFREDLEGGSDPSGA